jgi:hypothetical protein
MLSLFTPLSENFTQHSRQSSKAAYQPTEIILHTLDSIMSRLRRLPLPLQTLRNIFATAPLFTSQLTPPYTALALKNYPPYRNCSAGLTLWFRPVNLVDSAVLFGKEFFLWKRPFDHFILLDSTFAHYLWQPFSLIENGSGDVALWYRPGVPTYFAVPFEKNSRFVLKCICSAQSTRTYRPPLYFFKCITPMASREAHIGSVRHFQMVGLGKIGHSCLLKSWQVVS